MTDEAREVRPFGLDKSRSSAAPKNEKPPVAPEPDNARQLNPVMFTRPGEDYYNSDDPDAAPVYSDFRAMILPSDSEVEVPGEGEVVGPKDLSALESVESSPPSNEQTSGDPATTVLPEEKTEPAADKDNGQPKENESSTATSSSTQSQKPGKSEPPA